MEAIIFVGLQGAGKSSFYREYFFKTHIRLNLDMLRTRHRENLLLKACLEARQPFVIDNTNPTALGRAKYISLAKAARFTVKAYYFESRLADCLQRNAQRPGKEKIKAVGLISTYRKLELPSLHEGFDQLYLVRLDQSGIFRIQRWSD